MKNKQIIALVVGLVCVALTLFGAYSAISKPFYEIPLFGIILNDADVDQLTTQLETSVDQFESAPADRIAEFEKEQNVDFDKLLAFCKNPSVINTVSLGTLAGFIEEEVAALCKGFLWCIIIWGLFIAFWSLMGALLKKMVFPILAMIFSIGFYLAFVNIIVFVLFLAASIIHCVLLKKPKQVVTPPIDIPPVTE